MNLEQKINAASAAAAEAVAAAKLQAGEDRFPCGFAWVEIDDARTPLAKALKASGLARKNTGRRGVTVWNPGKSNWQNVDVARAGAAAFAAAFPGEAHCCSRLD